MSAATPSTRERGRAGTDRKTSILDAALRLIGTGGIDSVTHRRVAEAAGVPLGSTTYYFDSRAHLLGQAFIHHIGRMQQIYGELASEHSTFDPASIADFLVALSERTFSDRPSMLAEYELTLFAARDAELADVLHDWDDRMIAGLARSLDSLGAQRPFDGARSLLQLLRGYELDRLTRDGADADELRRRLLVVIEALVFRAHEQSARPND
jgi:DNA-binding transcriptional regulator YbjK